VATTATTHRRFVLPFLPLAANFAPESQGTITGSTHEPIVWKHTQARNGIDVPSEELWIHPFETFLLGWYSLPNAN